MHFFGRRRRRKRTSGTKRWRRVVATWLFAFLLVVAGAWYGTRVETLSLSVVTVSGGHTVPHEAVRADVARTLEGTHFFLIPRRFSYAYPRAEIVAAIEAMPRVARASVSRANPHTLHVSFVEHVPVALWCDAGDISTCLFLNADGAAFERAPRLHGSSFVRFVAPNRPLVADTRLLSAEALQGIRTFLSSMKSTLHWQVYRISLSEEGDAELFLPQGGSVRLSLAHDPVASFERLHLVRSSEQYEHLAPGTFHYIDLRFGNKVFIKETVAASSVLATTSEPSR